ncbi:MerR family transcriptional regulator [Aestuariibacter salexigens]|uniref:MerR family transcriptional regulator n=1 Tax=Aestuariibacter salexigens TaxID=226010 RepID=UPI000412CD03|nr:MerR family transcriptional regulator [Aestuariibacter salexigens]
MKVSEFARRAGVNVETVRFYHREGLLPIPKSEGAYRHYTSAHVEKMAFIKQAKLAGFTLEDIKQLGKLDSLRDKNQIRNMSELKMRNLENKIAELQSAKLFLSELVRECKASKDAPCPILETLQD